ILIDTPYGETSLVPYTLVAACLSGCGRPPTESENRGDINSTDITAAVEPSLPPVLESQVPLDIEIEATSTAMPTLTSANTPTEILENEVPAASSPTPTRYVDSPSTRSQNARTPTAVPTASGAGPRAPAPTPTPSPSSSSVALTPAAVQATPVPTTIALSI